MAHTNQDTQSIIERQKLQLAEYENRLVHLQNEHNQRGHAVNHLRQAINEAIAFSGRWKARGDVNLERRALDAQRLEAYFIQCKTKFEEVLSGGQDFVPAERPELSNDENPRTDVSQRAEQGSSEQEQSGDSQPAPARMDAAGSEEV